jgi:lysozyme
MCFNMGFQTLSTFNYTLGLIAKGDYHGASIAMGQSKWAHQVGSRATELQEQMDSGVFK